MLSGGKGAGTPFGVALLILMVLCGALGGWVRGPVARGLPAPDLARAGVGVVLICGLSGAMLLWRPGLGEGLPMWRFLICMAIGGLLLAYVGRTRSF